MKIIIAQIYHDPIKTLRLRHTKQGIWKLDRYNKKLLLEGKSCLKDFKKLCTFESIFRNSF